MKQSLGLIEVRGLALAVEVADAMAKSAAIRLAGMENTKGGGWMTIKVTGDVAAVKSALSTGTAVARANNGLVAQTVLSRADASVLSITLPCGQPVADTVVSDVKSLPPESGANTDKSSLELREEFEEQGDLGLANPANPQSDADSYSSELVSQQDAGGMSLPLPEPVDVIRQAELLDEHSHTEPVSRDEASCNLCHDPLCPRQKGEPRGKCLHAKGG